MILEPLELEQLKGCITKVNPEKLKERLKHVDDSYLKLSQAFVLAYTDLMMASKKLDNSVLQERLLQYLAELREFQSLFLFLDNYEHTFAKTKYRNRIIALVQGREFLLLEFLGFYFKLADVENISLMSDLGMVGFKSG